MTENFESNYESFILDGYSAVTFDAIDSITGNPFIPSSDK